MIDDFPKDRAKAFVHAHYSLPFAIIAIDGIVPHFHGRPIWPQHPIIRGMRKLSRLVYGRPWDWEVTGALLSVFRRMRPDVVLAEWGPTAVRVQEACRIERLPLVAHFHGYDASTTSVLEANRSGYARLFEGAAAIVAVSRDMRSRLIALGAREDNTVINPYGVDCDYFEGGSPGSQRPVFVAVGRFVEKKAPQLTILAFSEVLKKTPDAELRMIGDGPLRDSCEDLVRGLGIQDNVLFLGWMEPEGIRAEMRQARCFVQHSLTARNGDCEGLPNTILEAGACGLPVVSTRHAGIPDAVVEGETGFLVDEHDVLGMSQHMSRFALDARLASSIGFQAREHIRANFSVSRSLEGLESIIRRATLP